MSTTLPLREAVSKSILSGRFEDTKIILYSRRDSSGNVVGPRALYASSHVLKTVPYFNDRKSFTHASLTDRTMNNALRVLFGAFAEAKSKDFSEVIDDSETAEDYGYHSDSDLEDDNDRPAAQSTGSRETPISLKDRFSSSAEDNKSPHIYDEHRESLQQGKFIKIEDVAFITLVPPKNTTVLLTTWQIPGVFALSIHRQHRVRALRF